MEDDRVSRPRVMRPPPRRSSSIPQQVHERDLELVSLKSMEFNSSNAIKKLLTAGHLDYLVVGIVGGSGVGKSALLNLICELSDGGPSGSMPPFREAPLDSLITCRHTTQSIDLRINERRVIALDTPPVNSPSLLSDFVTSSSPSMELARGLSVAALRGSRPPKASAEALYKIMSTQVATFLLCVCHVVLFVFDARSKEPVAELLNFAELFARGIRSSLEEPNPMADSILVCCTKLADKDLRNFQQKDMRAIERQLDHSLQYSETCRSQKLKPCSPNNRASGLESEFFGVAASSSMLLESDVMHPKEEEKGLNLVALPDMKLQRNGVDTTFQSSLDEIRRRLLAVKQQRDNTFCEATWLKRCQVIWDCIWKSKDIAEYFFTLQETIYKNGGGW